RDRDLDVRSGPNAAAGASATEAEHFVEAGECAEVAHEYAECLGKVDVVEAGSASAEPGFAISVVSRTLLRIAEDIVRLGDLLEFLFGVLRPVVAIGVVLHRKLAICLLDVIVRGAMGHAENRIKVSHATPSKRLLLK